MKIRLSLILTILLIGLIGGSVLVSAQGTPTPLGIIPSPNPGSLTVNVWTNKSTYMVGETAQIYFTVNQQAYIYLYDLQPDGIVRLVFPNAYSQNNFVAAGTHVLPGRELPVRDRSPYRVGAAADLCQLNPAQPHA